GASPTVLPPVTLLLRPSPDARWPHPGRLRSRMTATAGAAAPDHTTTGDRAEHRRPQPHAARRGRFALPRPHLGRVLPGSVPLRRDPVRVQPGPAGAPDRARRRADRDVRARLA